MASKRTRRQVQSEQTRVAVIDAADRLFRTHGYTATTIAVIAEESGAAVQTVYNSVGGKAALLSAVLDRRAAGAEQRPVVDFLAERLESAPDLPSLIEALSDWFADVQPRTAETHHLIAQAAAIDPEVAELETRRRQQRLERYGRLGPLLRARGGLQSGMDDTQAAGAAWAIGSPAAYRALVTEAGWSSRAYHDWLRATLTAALS